MHEFLLIVIATAMLVEWSYIFLMDRPSLLLVVLLSHLGVIPLGDIIKQISACLNNPLIGDHKIFVISSIFFLVRTIIVIEGCQHINVVLIVSWEFSLQGIGALRVVLILNDCGDC